ncbi:uncharacterized protein LOC114262971 [Camellia sinensis]|uniref:uncharacterized protein LOC114262971 n=1 Tax=Camellia sinensis TaxID=4442 RepID=UPI0010362E4D|nr:uncharacterized protein LOC114262971 [Camellia sinensis]
MLSDDHHLTITRRHSCKSLLPLPQITGTKETEGNTEVLEDDFIAWTSRDILVYGEEIVLLYRSNIILLSSPAFMQLTIIDTENFWQPTDNYWHGRYVTFCRRTDI